MIVFKDVASIELCLLKATTHIINASKLNPIIDSMTPIQFNNRIAEYAVMFYIQSNFKRVDVIVCDDVAIHYGKPIGTILEFNVDVPYSFKAYLYKYVRRIQQYNINDGY